jgi:hypothetical protein
MKSEQDAQEVDAARKFAWDGKVFVFANTGKERTETLDFVKCDKRWDLGVKWVEAETEYDWLCKST